MTNQSPVDPSIKKDLLVAEFQNLRQEQLGRSNAQYAIIGENFTVAAAIGGVAITQYTGAQRPAQIAAVLILLIVPVVSMITAIIYYGEHQSIMMVSAYIRESISSVAKELGGEEVFRWENFIEGYPRRASFVAVIIVGGPLLTLGTGLLALTFSFYPIFIQFKMVLPSIIWAIEFLLSGLLFYLWVAHRGHVRIVED